MFQVAEGRGNCTPHKNPTPCTIPQDRESIFYSIFAFFTKSGRRVLVNRQSPFCTLTSHRSLTVSPPMGILVFLFFFKPVQHLFITLLSPTYFLLSFHHSLLLLLHCVFLKGLWPAWQSVYDHLLQSGSTVKRRSFEHRYKTSTQHWNS